MSFSAFRWAMDQHCGSASAKLVLVALADLTRRGHATAYASASKLSAMTELDRKTVLAALHRLQEARLLRRTGEVQGRGGAPVFELAMPTEFSGASEPDIGTASVQEERGEPIPVSAGTGTGSSTNQYQISRQPVPEAGHKPERTSLKPVPRKRRPPASERPAVERPSSIDSQVWADWLRLRESKRAPVTETVLEQAQKEAAKANLSLEAFLRIWCFRGTQGLMADWIKPQERQQFAGSAASDRVASQLRTASLMVNPPGHAGPKPAAPAQEVIDVSAHRVD